MALSAVRPEDPRCGRIVTGLLRARRGSYWRSTRSTSLALLALAEYLLSHPDGFGRVDPIRVTCNGGSMPPLEIPVRNGRPGGATVTVPADMLRVGSNRLSIEKGSGHAVYVSVDGEGSVSGSFVERSIDGVSVRRELFLAERVVDTRGRAQILEKPIEPDTVIPVGGEVGCRTIVQSERAIPYVLVQVFLPSGFEVTEMDYGAGWWKPYEYSERWDESLNYAFATLPEGETRITSLLRPELKGEFYFPPSTAWAMYEPEIETWSSSTALSVEDTKD